MKTKTISEETKTLLGVEKEAESLLLGEELMRLAESKRLENQNRNVFICYYCGAELKVTGVSEVIICPECKISNEYAACSNLSDSDVLSLFSQCGWENGVEAVQCSSCKASFIHTQNAAEKCCPFCMSTELEKLDLADITVPKDALPFTLNKANAVIKCSKWISSFFTPKAFKKALDVKNIQSVYFPVWAFGCSVSADYRATLGTYYNHTAQLGKKQKQEERIKWFNTEGLQKKTFNDILICGSSKMNEKTLQALRPFDKRGYVNFTNSLLEEACMSCYDLRLLDAFHDAATRMQEELKQGISDKHRADVIGSIVMRMDYEKKDFRCILLPVYVSSVVYKGKPYNQYINGNTGKIAGKKPVSKLKVFLTSLGVIALTVGAAVLITLLTK